MVLKTVHDSLDEIPEEYRELFTEKDGKFELTGIQGVKTQADVDRAQNARQKEYEAHKATKEKLRVWGDLDHEDVIAKLDRLPELEAAAKGKLDEDEIERIVEKRVQGTIASKLAGPERKVKQLEKALEESLAENTDWRAKDRSSKIRGAMDKAMAAAKVRPEAREDILNAYERLFDLDDEGVAVTRDNVGVTPGLNAEAWLTEVGEGKPHWFEESRGGGARTTRGGVVVRGDNPWSAENWDMTRQGEIYRNRGPDIAKQMARAAGTTLGGLRPVTKNGA